MKLQKLLKKLALPVFALVVVSMLAACSSPSGGGSDSNGGGGGDKTPELDSKKEYEISTDNMPDEVKEVLEKALEDAGIEASDSLTGAEIEEIKDALSEAGYTYTEKDGTITIIEKPAPSSGSEDKGEYTVKYEDLVLFTVNEEILKEMPTNAGTKNGNVITMSSTYIAQMLTGKSKDKGKEYVAVIFYGNDEPGFLEQEDLQRIENLLEKNTDYKISSDKKVIVITESGLVKYSGASTVFVDTDITDAPLFNVSELTVAADKISWTEGTWLFKEIAEYSDGRKKFETDKIKADSSGIKYTEMISTQTGTVTESMPKAQIDMLTAAGKIKGNQYTYTIKASEDDIAEENERIVSSFNRSISDLKTNAAKTKYYWEKISSKGNETSTKKYYLEKKSGTSTPVILPDSSDVNEEEKPVNKPNEPEQNGQSGSSENSSTYNIKYNDIYLNKDMPAKIFSLDSFLQKFDTSQYTKSGNTIILNDEGLDILISESGKYENKTYVTLVVYDNHMLEPLIQDDFNTLCKGLTYKADYETFAGTKIIILTDSGYEKAKEFFNYEGSSSEEHSGNSYKGKINPNQKYNVFDNKEYNGKEVKGSTFIATVLEHGWVEGKDYTVDNDKFTITFSDYKAPSESNTNDSTTQEDKPATLPEGIEADKKYTIFYSEDDSDPITGAGFAEMVAFYKFDENDYTVNETTIIVTESGLEKMKTVASESFYDIVIVEETDKPSMSMPKEFFIESAKKAGLLDSEYSIDDNAKKITLTNDSFTKFIAYINK